MKQLRTLKRVPPGGWRYVDPDTGFKFKKRYNSFADLVKHVESYRNHNKLPKIPKLEMVIQSWLAEQPNMARYVHDVSVKDRSLLQYLSGAKAAVKMLWEGERAFELQVIAEKRAQMCLRCRHNKPNKSDSDLRRYTDEYVQDIVGQRKTPFDDKLFTCEICSCALRPKVHIVQKIVEESLTRSEKRALRMGLWDIEGKLFDCWQVKPVKESE